MYRQLKIYKFCWMLLLLPMTANAGNTFPFTGLDTLNTRLNKVYSPGVKPQWLGESSLFWYRNYEKEGTFFYLVDAADGTKRKADTKEGLADFLKDRPELARMIESPGATSTQRSGEQNDGISPDGKWKAFIRNHNVYVVRTDQKDAQPTALSLDGAPGFGYRQLHWSPDSRKLAAMKVREVEERRIPLLESAPSHSCSPSCTGATMPSPATCSPSRFPPCSTWSRRNKSNWTRVRMNLSTHCSSRDGEKTAEAIRSSSTGGDTNVTS